MFAVNLPSMINRILLIFLLFFLQNLAFRTNYCRTNNASRRICQNRGNSKFFCFISPSATSATGGSKVLLYNGETKRNQQAAYAVVDLDIGKRDLQQCADAVIRLRAEYLYEQKQYAAIHFNFTNGFNAEYTKWAKGSRIRVNGNTVSWYPSKGEDYSYKTFRSYLDMVFSYCRNNLPIERTGSGQLPGDEDR